MREYVVQSGDTLSIIARRLLGSAHKWRAIAEANRITNPDRIRVGQKLVIPSARPIEVPPVLNPSLPPAGPGNQSVTFSAEDRSVFAFNPADGNKLFLGRKHKAGLFRAGTENPADFIHRARRELAGLRLSDSEVNVILATSENEGALDALNTWDAHFLSFGMFQWTSGGADRAGELPALLGIVKNLHPDEFHNYWGQFGLDVEAASPTTGWLSLNGRRLRTRSQKEKLRELDWALRFIRAGFDRKVQGVEVLHAVNRIDAFYHARSPLLGGRRLSDLVTSEYGVALLVDTHVNRPGYVWKIARDVLAALGASPDGLAAGGDPAEERFLSKYVAVREGFGASPMTDSVKRGQVTRRYVTDGVISRARGTFRSNRDRREV